MYNEERRSAEQLQAELSDVRSELSETRLELDRLRNLKSSSSFSAADMNNERRVIDEFVLYIFLLCPSLICCWCWWWFNYNDTGSDNCNASLSLSQRWDHIFPILCILVFFQYDRVVVVTAVIAWKCVRDVTPPVSCWKMSEVVDPLLWSVLTGCVLMPGVQTSVRDSMVPQCGTVSSVMHD